MQPSTPRLSAPEFLGRLDLAAQQFADLIATGDLRAPVPACPDWTFQDLVAHLGQIHQWATHAIVAGNPDAEPTAAPQEQAALVEWYRTSAEALTSVLKATDPQAPAWHFGPKPRTVSFWFRRQTHETTVHLWDAGASHSQPVKIDDIVALDGIDELTSMFFPRQVRLGRSPRLERTLALVAVTDTAKTDTTKTDADVEALTRWVLAGDGTGPESDAEAAAEATVTGAPDALLLLLWGRIGLDHNEITLDGDEAAAHAVLSSSLAP